MIQSISFHPTLMPSISEGKKTATVRAGNRDYYQEGNAIAKAVDGTKIPIVIESIQHTKYTWGESAITPLILSRENIKDTTEQGFIQLYEGLKKYYPDFEYNSDVTILYFHKTEY